MALAAVLPLRVALDNKPSLAASRRRRRPNTVTGHNNNNPKSGRGVAITVGGKGYHVRSVSLQDTRRCRLDRSTLLWRIDRFSFPRLKSISVFFSNVPNMLVSILSSKLVLFCSRSLPLALLSHSE